MVEIIVGWLYNRYRFCRGRDWFFGGICCRGLATSWIEILIGYSKFLLAVSRSLRPRGLKWNICQDATPMEGRGLCDLVD